MKKISFNTFGAALFAVVVVLASCQKEPSLSPALDVPVSSLTNILKCTGAVKGGTFPALVFMNTGGKIADSIVLSVPYAYEGKKLLLADLKQVYVQSTPSREATATPNNTNFDLTTRQTITVKAPSGAARNFVIMPVTVTNDVAFEIESAKFDGAVGVDSVNTGDYILIRGSGFIYDPAPENYVSFVDLGASPPASIGAPDVTTISTVAGAPADLLRVKVPPGLTPGVTYTIYVQVGTLTSKQTDNSFRKRR